MGSMGKEKGLTVKQQRFADYFIELGNGTDAAIKAGYTKKSARFQASANLKNPAIKEYVDRLMAEKDNERIAKQDEVLELLTKVLRGESRGTSLVGLGMGEQSVRQVPPTVAERTKAAELLGKRYGIWKENQTFTGQVGVVLIDDTGMDEDAGGDW